MAAHNAGCAPLQTGVRGQIASTERRISRCPIVSGAMDGECYGRPMQYASEMIRAFEPADEDDLIRVWLASTIPGQPFVPEEHWRAMEPEIREQLVPIAETWVVEEDGELVAFMSLLDNLIGGLFTTPTSKERAMAERW